MSSLSIALGFHFPPSFVYSLLLDVILVRGLDPANNYFDNFLDRLTDLHGRKRQQLILLIPLIVFYLVICQV